MFHRIMVPLDGSRRAETAIPVAARLARGRHSVVILIRSIETPSPLVVPSPELAEFAPPPEPPHALMDEAADYLASIATGDALAGIKTMTRVTEGPAGENILAQSLQDHVDLIVMCARGLKGFHRWRLGSVTQHVARHTQAPVLALIEPAPGAPATPFASAARALVPLDGSALAEAAIPEAVRMLAAVSPETGSLHLLRVISPFEGKDLGAPLAELVSQADLQLQRLMTIMREAQTERLRLTITSEIQVDTDAASVILKTAQGGPGYSREERAPGYDLIVMATHGRSGLARWTLGSLTERVLQEARLPVLVVRPVVVQAERAPAMQS